MASTWRGVMAENGSLGSLLLGPTERTLLNGKSIDRRTSHSCLAELVYANGLQHGCPVALVVHPALFSYLFNALTLCGVH
jgi:hypothetical protein